MNMKIIKSEKRICPCCMEEHEVKTVLVMDQATFKNSTVDYEASYLFCDLADELYMDEQQMQDNDIKLKDTYRKNKGLLISTQIGEILAKYGISQRDVNGKYFPAFFGILFPAFSGSQKPATLFVFSRDNSSVTPGALLIKW